MTQSNTSKKSFFSCGVRKVGNCLFAAIGTAGMMVFAAQMLIASGAQAYTQMQSRAIVMTSDQSGTLVIGQGVTYTITFQPNTAAAIGTIIVDFCVEDPIPGDTCTNPSGLNLTLSGLGPTGGGLSGWTGIHMIGSHNSTIGWDTTGSAQTPSGATVSMSITGVTNPTATGTFYGRILTYAATGVGETGAYTSTAIGTPIDAGGTALAITVGITITAKVQEQLTFCVWTGASCGTGNTINLGAASNGDWILSSGNIYGDDNTQFKITTNALHNVNVQAFGNVLTSGTNYIEASGVSGMTSSATYYQAVAGTPQYGFCVGTPSGQTNTTVNPIYDGNTSTTNGCTTTPSFSGTGSTAYNGILGTAEDFGFDISNLNPAGSGESIFTMVAGSNLGGRITFIADISTTTTPGVYTSTMMFVATGTF